MQCIPQCDRLCQPLHLSKATSSFLTVRTFRASQSKVLSLELLQQGEPMSRDQPSILGLQEQRKCRSLCCLTGRCLKQALYVTLYKGSVAQRQYKLSDKFDERYIGMFARHLRSFTTAGRTINMFARSVWDVRFFLDGTKIRSPRMPTGFISASPDFRQIQHCTHSFPL